MLCTENLGVTPTHIIPLAVGAEITLSDLLNFVDGVVENFTTPGPIWVKLCGCGNDQLHTGVRGHYLVIQLQEAGADNANRI